MIETQQVQRAMDDQVGDVMGQRNALFLRLLCTDTMGKDEVAEQYLTQFLVIPAKAGAHPLGFHFTRGLRGWIPAFAGMTKVRELSEFFTIQHRKTQHIGRLVLAPPFCVQRLNLVIVRQRDADRKGERGFREITVRGYGKGRRDHTLGEALPICIGRPILGAQVYFKQGTGLPLAASILDRREQRLLALGSPLTAVAGKFRLAQNFAALFELSDKIGKFDPATLPVIILCRDR